MAEKKNRATRTRNFATIVYPESANPGWKEILRDLHIPAFISPLHDMDCNPDGELKKPHHHVIFMFDSVKTDEQAKEIVEIINEVGYQKVNSLRAHTRYLCHLDNPEKAQYDIADIIALGGADYQQLTSSPSDKYGAIREMVEFCKSNKIYCYSELLEYAMQTREDWFIILCDNGTYVMNEYLKSRSWEQAQLEKARNSILEKPEI